MTPARRQHTSGRASTEDHPFEVENWPSLLGTEREARWSPPRLLARLDLRAGQRVLDLGCGPGFWTLPLAKMVGPNGIVWALDMADEMLRALASRHPPAQVRLLQSRLPRVDLPDASVDWVWAAFILHEVGDLEALVAELRRVLRAAGRVAVLEWRPDGTGADGPPRKHRLWPEQIVGVFRRVGLDHAHHAWQDADSYLIELASGHTSDPSPADCASADTCADADERLPSGVEGSAR
jgi:ubiquinone/menaquinone biosynthesis C-methylase UbiE